MKSPRIPKRIKKFLQDTQLSETVATALRDPRKAKGKRWGFTYLVDVFVTAAVLQTPTMTGVQDVSERMAVRVPDSTLAYLFERVDPRPLRAVLRQQARQMLRAKTLRPVGLPFGVLTIDGKTVWTGEHAGDSACQLQNATWNLRAMRAVLTSAASRPCVDQDFIPPATNEMGHFPRFWKGLMATWKRTDLFRLVTLDAGYTSKDHAALIDGDGYGYVMRINDSQPTLHAELTRLFTARLGLPEAVSPWERRGGKEVQRRLFRTAAITGWDGWAHLRQGWMVQTVVMHDDRREEVVETRYFGTNLVWGALTPGAILRVIRGHWAIENDCNWVLDVVWEEDTTAWTTNAKAVWTRHPLQTLSWLRLLAYNVVGWLQRVRLRSHPTWKALREALSRVLLPGLSALDQEVALALLG